MSRLLDLATKLSKDNKVSVADLKYLEQITNKVELIWEKIEAEHNRHNDTIKSLNFELKNVRDTCKHDVTTYYGDPSGGSDSHTTCEICGDSVDKRKR